MISLKELVEAGDNMRELQKKYFKTRDIEVLHKSKAAELKFDRMIHDYKTGSVQKTIGYDEET